MRGYRSLGLLLCTAGLYFTLTATATDQPDKENTTTLSRGDVPYKLLRQLDRLLSTSPLAELDRFVLDPDPTVALAAGWGRVVRTMPKTRQPDAVSPDAQAIARFLGLVEGRLRFPIPTAWENAVKSAKGYCQTDKWFSDPMLRQEKPQTGQPNLKRLGDQWFVKRDRLVLKLPAKRVLSPVDDVLLEVEGKVAYVALYGWPPWSYTLSAIDRENGKVLWSSEVWAAGTTWLDSGHAPPHFASMHLAGEDLVVFGWSWVACYVEVFDKRSGKNRSRFSTTYFCARPERE